MERARIKRSGQFPLLTHRPGRHRCRLALLPARTHRTPVPRTPGRRRVSGKKPWWCFGQGLTRLSRHTPRCTDTAWSRSCSVCAGRGDTTCSRQVLWEQVHSYDNQPHCCRWAARLCDGRIRALAGRNRGGERAAASAPQGGRGSGSRSGDRRLRNFAGEQGRSPMRLNSGCSALAPSATTQSTQSVREVSF